MRPKFLERIDKRIEPSDFSKDTTIYTEIAIMLGFIVFIVIARFL